MNRFVAGLVFPALLLGFAARAEEWAGTVKSVSGEAHAERNGQLVVLNPGDRVYPGDKLVSSKNGRIGVTLRDDTLISANPNSQIAIREFSFNPVSHEGGMTVSVLRGVSAFVSGLIAKVNPQGMRVSTPTTTIGIRGTEFVVEVENDD